METNEDMYELLDRKVKEFGDKYIVGGVLARKPKCLRVKFTLDAPTYYHGGKFIIITYQRLRDIGKHFGLGVDDQEKYMEDIMSLLTDYVKEQKFNKAIVPMIGLGPGF